MTAGRVICVFGAGGDRDRQKRPLMGRAVEQGADLAVITSDNPRSEDPQAIAEEILKGFDDPAAAHVILDRVAAIHWALAAGQARRLRAPGRQRTRDLPDHRRRADSAGRRRGGPALAL